MIEVRRFTTATAPKGVLDRVRGMVETAFDGDFSDDDWQHALGGIHVVLLDDDVVLSHVAVVPRAIDVGDRTLRCGYVEAVATAPEAQGHGHGSRAMDAANTVIRATFDVGFLSTGEHHFYERLGWERWQGPAFVAHPDRMERTADEDDGIMVLRFGTTRDLTLTSPITCPARRGDAW